MAPQDKKSSVYEKLVVRDVVRRFFCHKLQKITQDTKDTKRSSEFQREEEIDEN